MTSTIEQRLEDLRDDYGLDLADDRTDDGLEQCPVCRTVLARSATSVRDYRGQRYEHLTTSNPTDGPFFCEDCYVETVRTAIRSRRNRQLTEWSP